MKDEKTIIPQPKYRECPECDGTGSVGGTPAHVYDSYTTNIESYGSSEECQRCGGSGRIKIIEKP